MSQVLFANNATTTLAGAISNTATTANLASGTGALFPSPSGSQYFVMTFTDQSTGLLHEIVHVTAISGDTITIVRAQEGTSAQGWDAGDLAQNLCTAGTMQALMQQGGNYSADSGTANAITITITPAPTSLTQLIGVPLYIKKIASANTGALTINPNGLGNTVTQFPSGAAIPSGGAPASGILAVMYDGTEFELLSVTAPATTAPAHGAQYFSSTGTFTVPTGVTQIYAEVWGGGGGSSGGNGASGAAGGYAAGWLTVTPAATITATVGTGGAAASSGGTAGTGVTSTFSTLSATGGTGGAAGPGAGGSGSGGTLNISGQAGIDLTGGSDITNAVGGSAPRGGLGGTLNGSALSLLPTAPGGAGGADFNTAAGQAGAAGGIYVTW